MVSAPKLEKHASAVESAVRVLRTRHGSVDLTTRTAVMGIVNVTPDSFYDGGKRLDPARAVAGAHEMIAAGAAIVDIGGESSRPGAEPVPPEEELRRVVPVIRELRKSADVPISIDTYKAAVARAALDAGADIVNDISALRLDSEMASLCAREQVPVILMHMQGVPRTMQVEPRYDDVVGEVRNFLAHRARCATEAGIPRERIVVDPGIGFGKTLEHNLVLLNNVAALNCLGLPVLIGVSRKAFIGKLLNLHPEERLQGSLAAAVAAALGGAAIVRVHDVPETCRALRVADAIRSAGKREAAGR